MFQVVSSWFGKHNLCLVSCVSKIKDHDLGLPVVVVINIFCTELCPDLVNKIKY